ncbi:hypothetical protein [Vibrio sp. Isolate30]|uniref:hypothetical protein n=1 Tax=Vibrio sp. Isolate30 TaxID=2908536 RepID=UPI001EFD96A1|nr:hypothetical protein [Vibrio sp. Isolate30]MCG9629833.1 hypothetical protein [Vibrio sp. Isolate30]
MHFNKTLLTTSLLSALTLSGCGSDSSSPSSGNNPQMGGVVITTMDGYLKNALVCSDVDSNGVCDSGEEIKTHDGQLLLTDANGQLNLEGKITQDQQRSIASYPIVVKVLQPYEDNSNFGVDSGIYTVDMDHEFQPMDKNIVFRTPAGQTVANPFTDLVVAEMNKGNTQEEAEVLVAEKLSGLNGTDGLVTTNSESTIDLYADYVALKHDSAATPEEQQLAKEMHKTAQVLTETKSNAEDEGVDYDSVALEVTEQAVDTVNNASPTEIDDPDFKPVLPVSEKDGEVVVEPPVSNYQAKVDGDTVDALNEELSELSLTTVHAFEHSLNTNVNNLFSDKDQQGQTLAVRVANAEALDEQHISVSIENGTLTLKSVNDESGRSKVTNGQYSIVLESDDINSKGEVVGNVRTVVSLTIEPLNTKPSTDPVTMRYIQFEVLDNLSLTKGLEMNPEVIDISTLFYDEDGDELTIIAETTLAGVASNLNDDSTIVTLTGTPEVDGDGFKLYISAIDEDNNKLQAQFRLPEVQLPAPPVNNAPTVDHARQDSIQTEVNKLSLQQAEVTDQQIDIIDLFVDQDNDELTVSATTNASGLEVKVIGDVIHLTGTPVEAGTGYKILLEASDGELIATTELELPEILPMAWTPIDPPTNTAPVINTDEKSALQERFNALYLEEDIELSASTYSLKELFTDAEQDELNYQATTTLSGLDANISGDVLVLSGTPSESGTGYQVAIVASDGALDADVTLNLPEVEPAFVPEPTNTLAALLMAKPSYRYGHSNQNGKTVVYCYGSQLKADGTFAEAEQEGASCPSADSFVTAGTWQTAGDDVQMTLNGVTVQMTLNEDKSDSHMPRLHLFVKETTTAITKAQGEGYALTDIATSEPVTFLYGQEAATNYWAGNHAYGYVNGELTSIEAESKSIHNKRSMEYNEPLDVDIWFAQSCESLGYVKNDQLGYEGTYGYTNEGQAKYSFALINERFEDGRYSVSNYDIFSKIDSYGTDADECAIDIDTTVTEGMPLLYAGDNIAVFAKSTDANFEDVLLSTFIDRDLEIEPNQSLHLNENPVYGYELVKRTQYIDQSEELNSPTSASLIKMALEGDTLSYGQKWYYVPEPRLSTEHIWYPIYMEKRELTAVPYIASNGEQMYQASYYYYNDGEYNYPGEEYSNEAWSLWMSNDKLNLLRAGEDAEEDATSSPAFYSETEGKEFIEDLFAREISFVGTTWMSEDDGETVTYTYTQSGAIITFGNEVEELSWADYPSDLPCLVEDDHTCSFAEMNAIYEWNDVYDNGWVSNHLIEWTWNPSIDANVFYRSKDKREPEAMVRVQD